MAYDLTTRKSLKEALLAYGICLSPGLLLGKLLIDKFMGEKTSPEEQRETAIKLIQEAKRQGAKSIDIEMDPAVAMDLGVTIEGLPIKFGGRIGNKAKIHVDFC